MPEPDGDLGYTTDSTSPDLGPLGLALGASRPSEFTVRRVFQGLGLGDLNARLTSWMYTRIGIVEGLPTATYRQRFSGHGHPTQSGHQPHPHLPRPRRTQRYHQSLGKTPYTSQLITTHPTHVNRLCRPPAAEPWLWKKSRPHGVWSRTPEAVHGHDVDAVLVGVAPGSGVQRDPRGKTGTQHVAKLP